MQWDEVSFSFSLIVCRNEHINICAVHTGAVACECVPEYWFRKFLMWRSSFKCIGTEFNLCSHGFDDAARTLKIEWSNTAVKGAHNSFSCTLNTILCQKSPSYFRIKIRTNRQHQQNAHISHAFNSHFMKLAGEKKTQIINTGCDWRTGSMPWRRIFFLTSRFSSIKN